MTATTLDQTGKMASYHNVCTPSEMLALPHWVLANDQKIPHNPRTGRRASPTDPATWGTHAQAEARRRREGGHLGFALTRDAGIVCVDLDGCRDPESGEIAPWAQGIIDGLDSYTEPSVSGTGIHIYAYGTLPPEGRKRGKIEMYADKRIILVTGYPLQGHDRINERTAQVLTLHRDVFGNPEPSRPTPITSRLDLADDELLERAFAARNGDKVRRLYEGDLGDHGGDESAADLALVSHLCFWTPDDEQVARIVASSGLYRPKWDREDYRRRTITKARTSGAAYDPDRNRVNPQDAGSLPETDPNPQHAGLVENEPGLPNDPAELKRIVVLQRRKIVSLEAQYALLTEKHRAMLAAMASPNLGPEKLVAIAVADELEQQQASVAAKPTADGAYPVPLVRIGERTGDTEETVSNKLKKLDRLDLFEREVKYIPERVDPATGEITGGKNMTYIRPKVAPIEMLRAIAVAPPSEKGKKNGHGGARLACPDHPDAGTVKRWTLHCAECDKPLDKGEERIKPQELTDDPIPQDAGLVAADAEPPPPPTAAQDSCGYPLHSAGKSATCYNELTLHNVRPLAAPPGSVAATWLTAGTLPGFDGPAPPAPLDPWTDISHGRVAP